jgi:hypothetical protein
MNRGFDRFRSIQGFVWFVCLLLVTACAGGEVAEPLRIEEVHPANVSTGVWIRDPVWVRFSEPIDPATVTPARVTISSAEVASLAKELSLSADGLTLSITLTQQPALPATLTVALSPDIATVDGRRLVPPSGGWWWKLPAWQAMGGALDVDTGQKAIQPKIAVGPDGPVVVWLEEAAGVWEVRVKAWVDGVWTALDGALNQGPTNRAERARIAIDPSGAPVVAWAELHGDNWSVHAKRWDETGWTSLGVGPLDADFARHAHGGDVVSDGSSLWAAWDEDVDGGTSIHARRWDGAAWTPAGGSALDPAWGAGGPSVALGRDGLPVVAVTTWGHDTWQDVIAARWTGSQWVVLGGVIDVVAGRHADVQTVAVDFDDAPIVVWEESVLGDQGKEDVMVHAKRWDGAAWVSLGGPLNVALPAPSNAYDPSLTVDADGRPVAVWREGAGPLGIRVYAKRWTGSAWEAMGGPISDAWSEPPDIAVGGDGVVYVTWFEWVDDTEAVFVKRFNELP